MRIMIVGASGLIGSAVAARLAADGQENVAAARRPQGTNSSAITRRRVDLAEATDPQAWTPHLKSVDAVVNCAGTLQDAPGQSTAGVHVR